MVSSYYKNGGRGKLPAEYVRYCMVREWGIPYKGSCFLDTPFLIVRKIEEYDMARAEGERRKTISDKNTETLKTMTGK